MPQFNRNFAQGKMNKDLDERLVPAGQYRDAVNVEISTSEGSNVGALENLLGNTELTANSVPDGSFCVGSIVNNEENCIYYLVAGPKQTDVSLSQNLCSKDFILKYNVDTSVLTYVFVDIYEAQKVVTSVTAGNDEFAGHRIEFEDNTCLRPGMYARNITANQPLGRVLSLTDQDDGGLTTDSIVLEGEAALPSVGDLIYFTAVKILDFNSNRLITGINIVDDLIMFTDNHSEPKKINITRSYLGTGSQDFTLSSINNNGDHPTRLVSSREDGSFLTGGLEVVVSDWRAEPKYVELEDVTVIKKAPLTPPTLRMSSVSQDRVNSNGEENPVVTVLSNFGDFIVNNEPIETGGSISFSFDSPVDYRVNDVILLTNDLEAPPTTFTDFQVRLKVTQTPEGSNVDNLSNGTFTFEVLSVSETLPDADEEENAPSFLVRLEQDPSLFEFKFPRFGYRYKYTDGEYSAFSPFSEIAFLPGGFEYEPKKGYNLAMANKLRSLVVENYAPSRVNRPKDIVEIDILYKEEGSTSVYTVKSIKPTDGSPLWPSIGDYNLIGQGLRGSIEVKSELIHALVPSNQLIRPWDNVPRKALAQEISANRLIFANYLQNYDLFDSNNILVTPEINLTFDSKTFEEDDADIGEAKKSLKSMRTYQVGVVYKDEFGRETPVLADKVKGSVKVEKEFCNDINSLQAVITNNAPRWATSFKFFIKETSSEYYNLAMHKWYNAEDGNVWLAFNSSDRNKVDIDTFLELKKAHADDGAVEDRARYKIVAIENEAPEDIRIERQTQGIITNNAAKTDIGSSSQGFPFADRNFITVNAAKFQEALGSDPNYGYNQVLSTASDHSIRITGVGGDRSEYYEILRIESLEGTGQYKISIVKKFGPDVNFCSTNDTWEGRVDGLSVIIVKNVSKNKPEFDGKFFVKVYKDLTLEENVLVTSDEDYVVDQAHCLQYINTWGSAEGYVSGNEAAAPEQNPYNLSYTWGDNGFAGEDYSSMSAAEQRKVRKYGDAGNFFWNGYSDAALGAHPRVFLDEAWTDILRMPTDGSYLPDYAENNDWEENFINKGLKFSIGEGEDGEPIGVFLRSNSHGAVSDPGIDVNQAGSLNRNDYAWRNGNRGIYPQGGVYMMDISVTGIRPGFREKEVNFGWEYTHQNSTAWLGYADQEPNNGYTTIAKTFIDRIIQVGTKFRFREDPDRDENIYTVKAYREHRGIVNCNFQGTAIKKKRRQMANMKRNKFSIALDKDPRVRWDPRTVMAHDGTGCDATIEFLAPYITEDGYYSDNPAIFETYPKESIELDIYYELGRAYPVVLTRENDETLALIGSKIVSSSNAADDIPDNTTIIDFEFRASSTIIRSSNNCVITPNSIITIEDGWEGKIQLQVIGVVGNDIQVDPLVHNPLLKFVLPWFNCYSFGNGVESDRIRDDFNQPTIQNGVKASTTIAEQYKEERRGNGFIYSGIYNSKSGVNRLNQFIQGEKITKDINPDNGTIQKLFTRNTDIVTLCEDKVVKVLSNKDALFNADGNSNVTATAKVLGAVTPFVGDYGISKNPESFASDQYRCYFTDKQRGAVLRLSKDGLTPISDVGMKDYFSDIMADPRLAINSVMLGTFDKRKDEYNITFESGKNRVGKIKPTTVTFSEGIKGWSSFKTFIPESGVSINNNYYTFKNGSLWKHHSNEVRNDFYGAGVGDDEYSCVELLFNDMPSSVKNFQTINYEGTQARINKFSTVNIDGVSYTDKEYYNLTGKSGWYVEYAFTDLAEGKVPEFINKEGKWFNRIFGECTDLSNLDTNEFQVQGIGIGTISHDEPPVSEPPPPPPPPEEEREEVTITIRESGSDTDGTNWD